MKSFSTLCIILAMALSFQPMQSQTTFEIGTSFPFHGFADAGRDYFLTTQYSAAASIEATQYLDYLSTFSYTQHSVPFVQQNPYDKIGALTDSRTIYVPFTSDPFFSEYGLFLGGRLKTVNPSVQIFISGQLGCAASSYGTIEETIYRNPEDLPGGYSRRIEKGNVMAFDIAALYGAGIMFHPTNQISLILDLHAIDRFVNHPLDVYQGIGLRFSL